MSYERAEHIRDVLRYVKSFNNTTIVIHIDDAIINSPFFLKHISDISLIHEAGLHVVIVPGARQSINAMLDKSSVTWKLYDGFRITDDSAIPLIKTAAFDTANKVMTSLAGENKTALIGNWVKARGKGVIDGIDYGNCGEISSINCQAIAGVLENHCIPIFPCIGWSQIGKPYNISSTRLAAEIAIALKAEKLFFLGKRTTVSTTNFTIPSNIQTDEDGKVSAMTLEQSQVFLSQNNITNMNSLEYNILQLVTISAHACANDVKRSHIVDGFLDGAMLREIFSDIGQGTMVYKNRYGGIRKMQYDDIVSVLSLMYPSIQKGMLLERSEIDLQNSYKDYIVFEIDESIKACAALHSYKEDNGKIQAEIAAVVVDEKYSGIGIGPKLISFLIERAQTKKYDSIFILTTQAADWFESLGFVQDDISTLPIKRKQLWDQKRASKLFRLKY